MKLLLLSLTFLCFALSALAIMPRRGVGLKTKVQPTLHSTSSRASSAIDNVNFAASDPNFYDRAVGGGVFSNRTESLTINDVRVFQQRDIVSFFIAFDVDPQLPSNESLTAQFETVFESDSTAPSGAGYDNIVRVVMNEGDPYLRRKVGNTHTLVSYQTKYGTPFETSGTFMPYIVLSAELSGLLGGEKIVLRIDAELGCGQTSKPTGTVQAYLARAVVSSPAKYANTENAFRGPQTVPLKIDIATEMPTVTPPPEAPAMTTTETTPSPPPTTALSSSVGPTPAPESFAVSPTLASLGADQCHCAVKYVSASDSSVCLDYAGVDSDNDQMYCQLRPCKNAYKFVCDPQGTDVCTKVTIMRQMLRYKGFKDEPLQLAFCEYVFAVSEYLRNGTMSGV